MRAQIYEPLTRLTVHTVKAQHIATFLGKKLNTNFQGEADALSVTLVTAPGRSAPESNTNAHTLSIRKVVMVGLTLQAAQCRISENRRPHLIICVQSAEGKGYCYYR